MLAPKPAAVSLGRVSHDASRGRDRVRWFVERRCDAGLTRGGGEVGTEKQSSSELVSFSSREQTRGARSAWRRARNSSCDALGGAEVGTEESLVKASCETWSTGKNELVGFASSELVRGARWAWRLARNSSCDMKSAETSIELCEGASI